MATTIEDVLKRNFQDTVRRGSRHFREEGDSEEYQLIIPIHDTTLLRIPCLALYWFESLLLTGGQNIEAFVVNLRHNGQSTYYKSTDAAMKDVLSSSYWQDKLIALPKKDGEPQFYGSRGLILNEYFNIVAIQYWEVERDYKEGDRETKYYFKRPVLCINPTLFHEPTTMERYITGKLLNKCCAIPSVYSPYTHYRSIVAYNSSYSIRIEIDESPFVVRKVERPSVSTTNANLLEIAMAYVNDTLMY